MGVKQNSKFKSSAFTRIAFFCGITICLMIGNTAWAEVSQSAVSATALHKNSKETSDAKVSRAVLLWKKGGINDLKEAYRLLHEAAKENNPDAEYNLGIMHMNGQGVSKSDSEAVYWFRRAAAAGHTLAQYNLAVTLSSEEKFSGNDAEAVRWYRAAADGGHIIATYNLGVMYVEGRGVAKDDAMAILYFRRAANQGHARGKYSLGMMYLEALLSG